MLSLEYAIHDHCLLGNLGGSINRGERPVDPVLMQQLCSVLAGSFAVRRFPTFCAALVGGYTFLQWPLSLLFHCASIPIVGKKIPSKKLSNTASRFLAAVISAWFSLEILNYKVIAKVDRKDSEQAAQDQQQHAPNILVMKTAKILDSKVSQASPPILAGKTIDLTLLAVTRALDSLVVNVYRHSYPSFAIIAPASSTLTTIFQYADTVIFALSSGTVVRLHLEALPALSIPLNELNEFCGLFREASTHQP